MLGVVTFWIFGYLSGEEGDVLLGEILAKNKGEMDL